MQFSKFCCQMKPTRYSVIPLLLLLLLLLLSSSCVTIIIPLKKKMEKKKGKSCPKLCPKHVYVCCSWWSTGQVCFFCEYIFKLMNHSWKEE
uniref:Uncharacterized protein n=1 Tax=Octopus bimaculoides TaxID=37653 RepID=A0A0L8GIU5_OCTBM